jgi:nitrite reductase (NADH) small subunit/3-phenylpropionate/trans-cinnamate dioxygenase ferredoxin subunit
MGEFTRVASTNDIPPGEMIVVEVGGEEVVIANVGGEFYAFGNSCTHKGGPLGEGILTGEIVECPFHAGRFNVRTGEAAAPPPTDAVQTYHVKVDEDDIGVVVS